MYGLTQVGHLVSNQLQTILSPHGYRSCRNTPGLWLHDNKPILFTLIVDNFGVKYEEKKTTEELMSMLQNNYEGVTIDWAGSMYTGITLKWDYTNGQIHTSMSGYIKKNTSTI